MNTHENQFPYLARTSVGVGSPFVFAAPHSGRFYPDDFTAIAALGNTALRRSEDAYVDRLFEGVTEFGGTQLIATYARAYLDLNRAANELDATMFTPALNSANLDETHRVKAGLGLIPTIISENVPIYSSKLPAREAAKRTARVHTPYHSKLKALLAEKKARYGKAYLIDCHSMPSEGGRRRRRGPDIVLGDSWGSSCARELTSLAEELFLNAGFTVRRNVPYSGGFSTLHYGKPEENIEALQIEISRAIYMDETAIAPLPEFEEVRSRLLSVARDLISRTKGWGQTSLPSAAE